jgi:hypothetical protein
MRALSAGDILDVWEQGTTLHPIDRALLVLSRAIPGARRGDLASLGIGRRDALLIELRERTFGPALESYAECPFCSERLEFTLSTVALRSDAAVDTALLELDGGAGRFRIPNSYDLAAAVSCRDAESARRLIAERCVVPAAEAVAGREALDEQTITSMARAMSEADPCLDITIDLTCPACSGIWEMIVDIAEFLWTEIVTEARRILRDVHTLARAYGWSEREILEMTPRRRQSYLELVG